MSSETSSSGSDDAPPAPRELSVNLQVVSPSVGVNRPLLFPNLAASTTLKQLKERIRETLPIRPPDDHQRLIHRGRALVRETDTLLDVFGEDAVRTGEQQTMHLVVREASHSQTPLSTTASSTTRGQSPAPAIGQPAGTPSQRLNPTVPPLGPQPPPGFPRRNPVQPSSSPFAPPGSIPTPPANPGPDVATAFQHQHQHMSQWLLNMQREATTRAMNQNQRARATMGLRGMGDTGHPGPGQETGSGRTSPALGHYYRSTLGPNGQTYQVETIVRSTGPPGANGAGLSPADVQSILRNADMSQAAATMNNAVHRSASNSSLHSLYNRPLNQPGVTVPAHPLADPRAQSGRATPDRNLRSVSAGSNLATAGGSTTARSTSQSRQGIDVYILSSPEGPRGLLVNNNTSETYYSSRIPVQPSSLRFRGLVSPVGTTPGTPLHGNGEVQQNPQQGDQLQGQDNQQQQGQDPPQLPDGQADPDNPNEAGLPPLLLQIGPHIWLLFRLALFVWFFTSSNSSWGRWFSVIGMAAFFFVMSIGALHGMAELAWRPVVQQLRNMLPRPQPQRNEDGQNQPGDNQEPTPGEMAERLIAQREQDNWLQGQIRRVERAVLLFLASIAPGVAEEHIANLEAEARAQRQRQEAAAAEAEAEAARQREEAQATGEGNEAEDSGETEQPYAAVQAGEAQSQAPAEPLQRQDVTV